KLRPLIFCIRLDRWNRFRKREFQPHICVDMAVGNVMNDLANGPAAIAIRSIELRFIQTANRSAEFGGSFGDRLDSGLTRCGSDLSWHLEFSNRVSGIHLRNLLRKDWERRRVSMGSQEGELQIGCEI